MLEYFDAYLVGLTATPAKHTFGFFNQNLVMEYTHEQAVADGVNVDFDVYRIRTKITEQGATIERRASSSPVPRPPDPQDALGDARRGRRLHARDLDRDVVARDQIRTVVRTFRDRALHRDLPRPHRGAEDADLRQGRLATPRTSSQIVREEFGKGNDFARRSPTRRPARSPRT